MWTRLWKYMSLSPMGIEHRFSDRLAHKVFTMARKTLLLPYNTVLDVTRHRDTNRVSLSLSCCSHLGRRASVKPFVSLQFLNPKIVGTTPCLQWDSNPWSQRSSGWRQFMPQTARPLWSATKQVHLLTYLLTYGAEPFLRSCQLCSHSEHSQQF
jgi:hypothetical protein